MFTYYHPLTPATPLPCSCSYGTCRSETDVRYHLNQRDPQLYALLNQVYTNNRGTTGSGLKICYASG